MPIETISANPKKIAIVTGGSRGIGRSTVESLARRGVHTIFSYHTHGKDALGKRGETQRQIGSSELFNGLY